MAEGTNVGSVYLDLVVRDTVEKQIQAIAAKAQAQAQQAFSGIEKIILDAVENTVTKASKSAQGATSSMDKAIHKVVDSAASAGKQVEASFNGAFDKSVAMAQAKVNELVRALDTVTAKLNEQWNSGTFDPGSKATSSLLAQQEKLLAKLESAEERLTISKQAAAQKAALIADQQAAKQQAALERSAAAAERASARQAVAEQKAAVAAEQAAQRAADAEERAANRRKAIQASLWKNMLASAGSAAKSITGKLVGIGKGFLTAKKSASGFGSRLKGILSGALVFNVLSRGLTNMVQYMGSAISSSEEMKTALSNLKGAAATAAAPLWEALTPALTALANGAATALSYLSRLISFFTGKTVASMASAAKKIQSTAGTAKKAMASLAGFDEIQRLGDNSDGSGSENGTTEPNFEFQGQSSFFDSVMESIKAGQWSQVGALVAQKLNDSLAVIQWPDIQEKAKTWTQNVVDTINGFTRNLNWESVGSSIGNGLNTIWIVISTFFGGLDWVSLGQGFASGINGLVKTVDWPQIVADLCAGLVSLMDGATAFICTLDWVTLGTTIYDSIMAIDWGGMFAGLLELLAALATGLLISLGAGLFQSFQDLGTTISSYFTDIGETGIQGFLDGMWNMLCDIGTWLYDHLVKPVVDGVCNALGIHSPSTVFASIGENLIAGLFKGISDTWTNIATFFTDAFETLKEAVTSIWEDGIVPAIKGPINSIIGFINGMISGVCEGINTIIRAMNKLKWDIPEWVPVLGGKSFGFNLGTITAPQIPMLANGGVITQPTLAMMGEYSGARNNPEIAAPQSVLVETISAVMDQYAASNLAGQEAIIGVLREILEAILGIEIGDDVIGQAVARYNRKMAVVRGGT